MLQLVVKLRYVMLLAALGAGLGPVMLWVCCAKLGPSVL